jgi:hypothetical protein
MTAASIVMFATMLLAQQPSATNLRITDSTGVEVLVTGASIDYGGMLGSDRETGGIRVYQGEGTVTASWSDIVSLTVTGRDGAATPPRLMLEIALTNGKTVTAGLVRKGRMVLSGKSDLGEYTIDLEKVKKIVPVHGRRTAQ